MLRVVLRWYRGLCTVLLAFILHLKIRFSSAVRQMPGDLCSTPRIISLSPLSLATDVTDATFGPSYLWLGTRTGAGGTRHTTWKFFFVSVHGSMDDRTSEENPGKPQLGHRLLKASRQVFASNGVPYLQMTSLGSHSTSGRKKEGMNYRMGIVDRSLLSRTIYFNQNRTKKI